MTCFVCWRLPDFSIIKFNLLPDYLTTFRLAHRRPFLTRQNKHTSFVGRGYKVKSTAKLISILGLVDLVLLRAGLVSRGFASGRDSSQCLLNCERVSRLRSNVHYGSSHIQTENSFKYKPSYGLDSGSLLIPTHGSTSFSKPQGSTSCSFKFSSYTMCARAHRRGLGLLANASRVCSLSAHVLGFRARVYGSNSQCLTIGLPLT